MKYLSLFKIQIEGMLAIENHSKSNISGKIAHISYRSAYLTNRKTYVEYHSSRIVPN